MLYNLIAQIDIENLPDDPEALKWTIILMAAIIVYYFVRGRNAADPTAGLLKLATDQLEEIKAQRAVMLKQGEINGEQLKVISDLNATHQEHERAEEAREQLAIARHEATLQAFQEMVKVLSGSHSSVIELVEKVGELDKTMNKHVEESPEVLSEIQDIKRMIQGMTDRLDTITGRLDTFVSTTTKEVETVKTDLKTVAEKTEILEQRITQEMPSVPAPKEPEEKQVKTTHVIRVEKPQQSEEKKANGD